MKTLFPTILAVLLLVINSPLAAASAVVDEFNKISSEVAKLGIGFGDYVLGKRLTGDQITIAEKNGVEKALKGTYKFRDGDVFVISSINTDTVIGIYKNYPDTTFDKLKPVIGNLMFEHGEPTAMAHDKMIYWTYNEKGKIEQDQFDLERNTGGIKSLATVKFSSSEAITQQQEKGEEEKKISAYVMITSDPLSKLFLAQGKTESTEQ